MAKLTTKMRSKLPTSAFAGPGRSFPVNDKPHAIAAERLVQRSVNAGNTSAAEASKIRSRAKAVIERGARPKNMIARATRQQ